MGCHPPLLCLLVLSVCLALVSATDRECSSVDSGSCPDPTTLLQSRVQLEQEQEDELAASADVQVAVSTHKNLNPPQFLIMSSSEGKVVWTMRQNQFNTESQSKARAHTLIDYGLKQPKGLAFDKKNGQLYIADSGLQKIFRYTLVIDKSQAKPQLATTHVRLTIVQNCGPVEWVTLDDEGNLFYSSPRTNNINKISANVMRALGTGEVQASALTTVSEKILEAHQSAANAKALKARADALPTDPPPVLPQIHSIYEAQTNSHVAHPGAIVVDGPKLYWANQADGTKAGTVVQGQVSPKAQANSSKSGPAPFPAESLTNMSSGALGIAKTQNVIFFSRNETIQNAGMVVSGLVLGTDIVIDFVKGLAGARALVWDKDETMYVADELNGKVFAFPTGRVMANAPRTLIVSLPGAYGLAIASSADPWFNTDGN